MNKSESKYFHTAPRMNEALISLLEKKDLEFITVKEICETAGVNRSTFYLHYETISDLMNETVEMVDKRLLSYFSQRERDVLSEMNGADLKELVLVSRAYLLPYLRFIRDNKRVYRAAFRNLAGMQAYARYEHLKNHSLGPILARFEIPPESRRYYIAYYVEGIIAIVKEWLRRDCIDEVESISDIIENCVRPGSANDGE